MIAADLLVAQNIGFAIIAAIMVIGALRVVTTSNVVHAALWLVVVLAGAAAQYVLLAAEFVAITQVLVYIGAVMVLFLFGTMLTRARIGVETDLNNKNWFMCRLRYCSLQHLLSHSMMVLAINACLQILLWCRLNNYLTKFLDRTCCRSGHCRSFFLPPLSEPSCFQGGTKPCC